MEEMRPTLLFALLCFSAFVFALIFPQTAPLIKPQLNIFLLLNGIGCAVIVTLIAALWIWDMAENEPAFRFRRRVALGMFAPFAGAFAIWSIEYFGIVAAGARPLYSTYAVPLLLAISGFEMIGLPDGERIHPLLGAYDPRSLGPHPLTWLTRDFAFYSSVGVTWLAALLVNVYCHFRCPMAPGDVLARSIDSFVNSGADIILALGLLRILNAHSFDIMSSWPAYLLLGDAFFQWAEMWDPYHGAGALGMIVPVVSLCIKMFFIASLLNVLAAVHHRAQEKAKIMISYRHDEALLITSRMYESLVAKFSKDRVFRDTDSTPLGKELRDYIGKVISRCAVVLVVIGPKWLSLEDAMGRRRLDDPDDLLRMEIALALRKKGISVIPLLIAGATLPTPLSLPEDIRGLVDRRGMTVSEDLHFKTDMESLIRDIESMLAQYRAEYLPQGDGESKTEAAGNI